MIGSYRKWGTEGHIEENKKHKRFYKKRNGKVCIYKDADEKCTLDGYVNNGLNCKHPGGCHHFKDSF